MNKVVTFEPACCAALLASPHSAQEADELAAAFKALADPVRPSPKPG